MNSNEILTDFFNYVTLPDARERLSSLLDVTVTGSYNKELSCRERCNLVYFIHQLEEVVRAAHEVYLEGKHP
jgi:hypothetical protein